MIAGVCGGIGAAIGIDPIWIRLAFVILTLGSGAGVVLYIVAWVLMPEEGPDSPARHGRVTGSQASLVVGLILVAVGAALLIDTLVPWFDRVLWPLAVIAAGIGLVYAGSRR